MALSDQQRIDIRRFCGYYVFGNSVMPNAGYRFFQAYGMLEYRLTNMTDSEVQTLIDRYLTPLYKLETDIPSAADNLDTDKAAVWERNRKEVEDRIKLFDYQRHYLCTFMGIPPGPGLEPDDNWN